MTDNDISRLFAGARRYCFDRISVLYELVEASERSPRVPEQAELSGEMSQSNRKEAVGAHATLDLPGDADELWAQISLLEEILHEVETKVPDDFSTVAEVYEYVRDVGEQVQVPLRIEHTLKDGVRSATRHECEWTGAFRNGHAIARWDYLAFLATAAKGPPMVIEPAHFRHLLTPAQRDRIGELLRERWDVDPLNPLHDTWYPLLPGLHPAGAIAFRNEAFARELGGRALSEIVAAHGVRRVWTINNSATDREYELDPRLVHFWGFEQYWSSEELDWVVYVSHEGSITIAGDWLVQAVKTALPTWQQALWPEPSQPRL